MNAIVTVIIVLAGLIGVIAVGVLGLVLATGFAALKNGRSLLDSAAGARLGRERHAPAPGQPRPARPPARSWDTEATGFSPLRRPLPADRRATLARRPRLAAPAGVPARSPLARPSWEAGAGPHPAAEKLAGYAAPTCPVPVSGGDDWLAEFRDLAVPRPAPAGLSPEALAIDLLHSI